ncbi:MAG: cytochrome c3 family protein [Nitrospinota bacterium]
MDSCWDCHKDDKSGRDHRAGIHYTFGVGCADCHGGDPTKAKREEAESKEAGFKARISAFDIPELCAKCHGKPEFVKRSRTRRNSFEEYKEGVHAAALWQKEEERKAPQCVTCHEAHRILRVDDLESPAHPANVNQTCGKCHGSEEYREEFDFDPRVPGQVAKSVHGLKGPWNPGLNLPTCASCHGAHWNFQPKAVAIAGFQEVFEVCGTCHTPEREAFGKDNPHFRKEVHCSKCHGPHEIVRPTPALFRDPKVCAVCHDASKKPDDPALTYISRVLKAVAPVEESMARSRRALKELERRGFPAIDEAIRLNWAERALLTGFGQVQHRLDLKRNLRELEAAGEQAKAAEGAILAVRSGHRTTRIALWGVAAYAALLVGILWLRGRRR